MPTTPSLSQKRTALCIGFYMPSSIVDCLIHTISCEAADAAAISAALEFGLCRLIFVLCHITGVWW
jgi:hypothetical protein